MRFLTAIFFFPSFGMGFIYFGAFFTYCFVWARACFPRFRYDFLMKVAWKIFLPISLCYLYMILM
jgi:NADH-quinone oxidoreductase subunit H